MKSNFAQFLFLAFSRKDSVPLPFVMKPNIMKEASGVQRVGRTGRRPRAWASEGFFPGGAAVADFPKIFSSGGQKWWNLFFTPWNWKTTFSC